MKEDHLDRNQLERLVAERTARLEQLNQHLQREIERRKRVEQELRQQKEFINLVIETSPHLIFVKDKDGTFLLVNRAMAESYKMSREEMEQRRNAELHKSADEVEGYARIDREVIRERKTRVLEESFTTDEGDVQWYHTIKTPLVQADGTVHVLGISTNITKLKRAQQAAERKAELQRLVVELEAKNAELERFTYTVSHDLKAPLVTILGFLGMLEQDVAKGKVDIVAQDIDMIRAGATKMARLLDELLKLSRVGRMINTPEAIELTDLAREAAELVTVQAARKGVTITIDPEMPVVFGDRVRLLEVWQNLLENAIKFMGDQPEPRIEIGAWGHEGRVVCFVQDNGIGIAPRYHKKIFGLFERLQQHIDGTGIGLALVKQIVELHGGTIWVESEGNGHGATFYVSLPQHEEG